MTSKALTLPSIPSEGGLTSYFREIWRFPLLEKEQEFMLAERWRSHEDTNAAHQLVTSHLRLVAKIAMGYRGYGLPVEDLVAEGNIGLMKAVKKFEPERGFRLSTYAMWWIRASITEYILRSWSMVKLGTLSAQKKLFFSLRRHKKRLKIVDSGELTPAQARLLSDDLDISERDIVSMNRRLAGRDLSLNAPMGGADGDDGLEFQDTLEAEGPNPEVLTLEGHETDYRRGLLRDAMDGLDTREKHIFVERRLTDDPKTLEELGQEYGISRERIRQLEARAFKKVEAAVREAASDV